MPQLEAIHEPLSVSVVVPLYNKATYIENTVVSILSQSHPPDEIIVVNDGSTDEGPSLVQAMGDERIRLIHQENQGPGSARNRGLRAATAPYIAFLDADDEWLPNFLETALGHLRRHASCALCVTGQYRGEARSDWGNVLSSLGLTSGQWQLPPELSPADHKPNLDVLHSGAIVCDRTIVNRFGGFYAKDRCTYGEDIYLWLQVILNYPIYRDLRPLMWYHTEASDLAVWKQVRPPWPMLLDPEPLRRSCPENYRPILESILNTYAAIAAYRATTVEDLVTANRLFEAFPDARKQMFQDWRKRVDYLIANVPNLRRTLKGFKR
ncbi:glycosyltransferase family 2 protein [Leptolyngbya cf. ectocarpi LEGE 11479]|uniref:Glycosyltransferase family 2 protein n=1 Tax=Leptolyngbya cf. ectocarpi LEGE 11479 TaxID=1828722 RepID=A0A929F7B7_LEPEC|nr:glycosyltransferase family 2 protein [Leptolyngbya ectocarpi]MBE9068660.1 glycosyltransferase family 2 protein [Leptolyngbya cf. ectocarpi LEGE 11479]